MEATIKTKSFLNPETLLRSIPIEPNMIVADFGCGNGYYAVASAVIAGKKGQVYALDILDDSLSQTATLARLTQVHNVSTMSCDLEKIGSCKLADTSCDVVIISSLMHQVANHENVLREAYRVLKTGGKILIVEWLPESPFGPEQKSRMPKTKVEEWLPKFGFRPDRELPAGSFHYSLLYEK